MSKKRKFTNGIVILIIALIHSALTPFFYSEQFNFFSNQFFFIINGGFAESQLNYETFAAFWCLFFGLIMLPLGVLLHEIEKKGIPIPRPFILAYLIVILIGVYMIPLSGMTFLMLPHVFFMLIKSKANKNTA
jgi:hypothetical protein